MLQSRTNIFLPNYQVILWNYQVITWQKAQCYILGWLQCISATQIRDQSGFNLAEIWTQLLTGCVIQAKPRLFSCFPRSTCETNSLQLKWRVKHRCRGECGSRLHHRFACLTRFPQSHHVNPAASKAATHPARLTQTLHSPIPKLLMCAVEPFELFIASTLQRPPASPLSVLRPKTSLSCFKKAGKHVVRLRNGHLCLVWEHRGTLPSDVSAAAQLQLVQNNEQSWTLTINRPSLAVRPTITLHCNED